MKKLITTLLLVLTVSFCIASLASCDGKVTVKFSANGGAFDGGKNEISVQVDKNSILSEPEDNPTKDGYYFAGWSKKEDTRDLWNFEKDKVTANMTLYASWSKDPVAVGKDSYVVNIKTQGGMPMEGISVYIWSRVDGELDDIVDYKATDANGSASFTLEAGGDYVAKIDSSVPDGYDAKSYYPLISNLNITLTSSLLPSDYVPDGTMKLGDVMYDFTVTLADGKNTKFTLSEALKEKDAVVINFWYDGCSWCETEFPILNKVYLEQGGDADGNGKYSDDIAFIALSDRDNLLAVQNYKNSFGLGIDMAPDLGGVITGSFNVTGWPTTVVIDRYGVITLIEAGALPSERPWQIMFDHFRGDDYKQQLIPNMNAITPVQKPSDYGFEMPPSEELGNVFEKNDLNFSYSNEKNNEYSWPFIIDEYKGEAVIRPSNKNIVGSYAQLFTTVTLNAGDVVAFDYFSSTELNADRLYVLVNKQDIYSISGIADKWQTCYAYVAEEAGTYELAFCYIKDGSTDEGDDTVYMKDLRIVTEADIDSPSYIYRDAATNPDEYNVYQDYVEIFLGRDGYYHVGSEYGPLLLADLMGYTLFNSEDYAYNMCIGKSYEKGLTMYASYASNSEITGVVPVTPELKGLLKQLVDDYGYETSGDIHDENEWLLLCIYYDAYGTGGAQLADPIKGLATFSAYDTILGGTAPGANVPVEQSFPNAVTYNRVIMPRGLLFAFTPTVSGVYKVTSHTDQEVNAWIFRSENVEDRSEWLVYDNVTREIEAGDNNCYMMAYLNAGETYYIDIAYYDVYATGTIRFRVDRVGDEGYHRFSLASPGFFTYIESTTNVINKIIAGGIKVEFYDNEDNGLWHEYRDDGRLGAILYADFTKTTNIFSSNPIYNGGNSNIPDLISAHAFDFRRTEDDQYILNFIEKHYKNGTVGKTKAEAVELAKAELREMWGETYEGYNESYKIDEVCEMFIAGNERYHGTGEDLTDEIRGYLTRIIKVGSTVKVVNKAGNGYDTVTIKEGDPMIGCIAVDARLAEILQQLMDKYTFAGVENSWIKLCYYRQYFCEATPK